MQKINICDIPKQLNKTQEIHQESDDEEPLHDVKILISKEDSAPAKNIADRYDKFTCFLFGIIFCLMALNLAKFLGYWPMQVEIEIITDPDIEITWQSMPSNLHVTHTTIPERAHALVQNKR